MLGKLGDGLKGIIDKITKRGHIDEALLDEIIRDIQRSLLQADVEVKLVYEMTSNIKEAAKGKPPEGMTPREHVIKTVYDELVRLLGDEPAEMPIKPTRILLLGLFGAGKTTTSTKIAKFYQKRGLKPGLIGVDVHRPAAAQQLEQNAKKIDADYYIDADEKDPTKILKDGLKELKDSKVIIVDSAGRDALDKDLIEEIKNIDSILDTEERLLVIPADIGQSAKKQAEKFKEALDITGVVVTKLDSTAKGGGALSACHATGSPVKLIGTGEGVDDLDLYEPERFVGRLLGMGDLKALLEKAKEIEIDEDQAKRMMKGEFDLKDFKEQMGQMTNMGSLSKISNLIPGMGNKIPEDAMKEQEKNLEKFKFILDSFTEEELENPDIINKSRIQRVAKGSGTSETDVRTLLKQYKQSKKMMKMFKGGKPRGNMKKIMKNMNLDDIPGL